MYCENICIIIFLFYTEWIDICNAHLKLAQFCGNPWRCCADSGVPIIVVLCGTVEPADGVMVVEDAVGVPRDSS